MHRNVYIYKAYCDNFIIVHKITCKMFMANYMYFTNGSVNNCHLYIFQWVMTFLTTCLQDSDLL